mgnify:CR=1 FL=1|jgi:hypothetical protein
MEFRKNLIMKIKLSLFTLVLAFVGYSMVSCAQDSKRQSPLAKSEGKVGNAELVISYSQPFVKGREIWGDLVPYEKVWRTGANEATTIELSQDIMVEGKMLKAGKYSLFTIPTEENWIVIFNETWEQWGAYKYEESKDVLRVEVAPKMLDKNVEKLTFSINGGLILLQWEKLTLPIKVSAK